MELVKTVLHFVLCPNCGKHGHFVTSWPLTVTGMEFYSKQMAFLHLDIILEKKMARADEVEVMREFIRELAIPWSFTPEELAEEEPATPLSFLAVEPCKHRFESYELN